MFPLKINLLYYNETHKYKSLIISAFVMKTLEYIAEHYISFCHQSPDIAKLIITYSQVHWWNSALSLSLLNTGWNGISTISAKPSDLTGFL